MIFLGFGLLFWAILAVVILASVVMVENDMFMANFLGLVAVIVAMNWFFKLGLGAMIMTNPLTLVVIAGIYLIIGSLYATQWKFRRMCNKNAVQSKKARADYDGTDDEFNRDRYAFKMHPGNHYDKIVGWALFWPESMLWVVLQLPIEWLGIVGKWVYRVMAKTLMSIAIGSSK